MANGARDTLSNYDKWVSAQLSEEPAFMAQAEASQELDMNEFTQRDERISLKVDAHQHGFSKARSADTGADTETEVHSLGPPGTLHERVLNPTAVVLDDEDSNDARHGDEERQEDIEYDENEEDENSEEEEHQYTEEQSNGNSLLHPRWDRKLSQAAPWRDAVNHFPLSRLPRSTDSKQVTAMTISDDQSAGSKISERILMALRSREDDHDKQASQTGLPQTVATPFENHSLQDYQMQHMLLEQQNKKRLLMARQEAETNGPNPGPIQVMMPTGLQRDTPPQQTKDQEYLIHAADITQLDRERLQIYAELLRTKVKQLESSQQKPSPPRYKILNRIVHIDSSGRKTLSMPYFDEPKWIEGQGSQRHLKCHSPITNFELFLERNKDLAFIVFRDFKSSISNTGSSDPDGIEKNHDDHDPQPTTETIFPISRVLIEAIKTLLSSRDEYSSLLHAYQSSPELYSPYLVVYNSRRDLHNIQEKLIPDARKQFALLLRYILDHHGDKYAKADCLFSENKISSEYVPYLFKPGDILVERTQTQDSAFVASDWPTKVATKYISRVQGGIQTDDNTPLYKSPEASKSVANKYKAQTWSVRGWYWIFDGHFKRQICERIFHIEIDEEKGSDATIDENIVAGQNSRRDTGEVKEQRIQDLRIYPLAFAQSELLDKLQKRGNTLWKCRSGQLVSYVDKGVDNSRNMAEERYMIDLKTYYKLHPRHDLSQSRLDKLGEAAMAKNEPPDDKFKYLLPPVIKGYNLRLKKWFDLDVDRITEVTWNVEAFESLVIDRKAKNLILALVSNQIATEKSTDLIAGKGNGLILLLHGGPGTGKTLTAESVAEIAQKPLYRVTCGDVGTKAEDVEKYLESVFHLGKIWGCVVLLDEADVFLEQRSLQDLARNALVSVFLRVLEYYEGILVLTSNRVGTFDEAFKSRIQLALHYPSLGQYQRLRVWENFIKRLESFGDDKVDTDGLRDHLEDLSKEKMNGRQIRNAITTARQYADWESQQLDSGTTKKMTYEHLKDVIEVANRFDRYLDKLHGGFSADQLAEDEGLRLA